MRPGRKWNTGASQTAPEALAARLPADLGSMEGIWEPDDYRAHRRRVADWINTQIPGRGDELASPTMVAAGMSVEVFFRMRLEV
jgi:hypothetical protein